MRESMVRLTPRFSANRAVREYAENYYVPAAGAYRERERERGAAGVALVKWRQNLSLHWGGMRFGNISIESSADRHLFEVPVYLDDVDADAVRVELYAEGRDGAPPLRQEMTRGNALVGSVKGYLYTAAVPSARPAWEYTARIVPCHEGARVPLEAANILWSR
jgi:starch phosphorylase